ncbi:MAG: hypothetical protein U5L08_02710 [Xanthomonadales bacterium]|nr:hypothetical protein [Xanthomonadales bacterium]
MKDGDQDPRHTGLIFSEKADKFVSRAEYNATRDGRGQEYNIVQDRALRLRDKIANGEDGPLDYFTLQRDLLAYISQYCTDQNVLNLIDSGAAYLLNRNLEQTCRSRPDVHGLSAREDRQRNLVRYWLVRELNERGYNGRRKGMNNKVSRAYALAIMQHEDLPVGKGRNGEPLTDEALRAAVKSVAEPGDDEDRLDLKPHPDEDDLPAWAITDSERAGIPDITLGYIAQIQRQYPDLPRPK